MNELIEEALAGNKEAYIELINSISVDLYKIAKTKLNNVEDINDAIQETILRAYNNLHKLNDPNCFNQWIFRILTNACTDIHKHNFHQQNIFEKLTNKSAVEDCSFSIDDVDAKLNLSQSLKMLDSNDRLLITLYYQTGLSTAEIATVLNTNINTVKSRLARARAKLEKIYEGGIADEPKS